MEVVWNGVPVQAARPPEALQRWRHALPLMQSGGPYFVSYENQWRQFIECTERGTPVQSTLDDGRRALQVVLAGAASAAQGRTVNVADAPRALAPVTVDGAPPRGKRHDRYCYWRPLKPGTYKLELTELENLAIPFWSRLRDGDKRAAIINPPESRLVAGLPGVAIPCLYTSLLRVNLRGREPQGIVDPGSEYQHTLDRLEGDLRQLVDPQTNRPAVKRMVRTVDLFGGGPPSSLPDMFVEWTPTTTIRRKVVHPKAVPTQENLEYSRGSPHTYSGFVAAAGPSIGNGGRLGDIDVLDLAPTFPERPSRAKRPAVLLCAGRSGAADD